MSPKKLLALFSGLLLLVAASCKPMGTQSDVTAITGTDSDGKRKAFSLIPIKPVGFVSPMALASLGLVECQAMDGMSPEVVIRQIELIGAVGQLFYDGARVRIPRSAALRPKGRNGVLQDPTDTIPVGACSLFGSPVPYSFEEVEKAANVAGRIVHKAKSWNQVKEDYLVAQTVFLAMRGATDVDSQGRPLSLDGAPLLAQLEIMSNRSARSLALNMRSQDSLYNPCMKSTNEGAKVLQGKNAKKQFYTCGKQFKVGKKRFHHYEVGGTSKEYTYSRIKNVLKERLNKARDYVAKGANLTDGHPALASAAPVGFGLQDASNPPAASEPVATQPAATQPAATQPAATQPAATQPAAVNPATGQSTTEYDTQGNFQIFPPIPASVNGGQRQNVNPTRDTVYNTNFFIGEQDNSFNQITQSQGGQATVQTIANGTETRDGTRWETPSGGQVNINADRDRMQIWDSNGNLVNQGSSVRSPNPYRLNFDRDAGEHGTFQLMRGDQPIGQAMPAVASSDGRHVGITVENQTQLVDTIFQEATTDGTVDTTALGKINETLQTANAVSFYRDNENSERVADQSMGNIYNVFQERVARENVELYPTRIDMRDGQREDTQTTTTTTAETQTPTEPSGPSVDRPGSYEPEERAGGRANMVDASLNFQESLNALRPGEDGRRQSVNPDRIESSVASMEREYQRLREQAQRMNTNENAQGDVTQMTARDRARTEAIAHETRQLQSQLAEMEREIEQARAMADRIGEGPGDGARRSSYQTAVNGLLGSGEGDQETLRQRIAATQRQINSRISEIDRLSNPYEIVDDSETGRQMLRHTQGMLQNQIDGLSSRRTRIQSAIRDARESGDFDRVQRLEGNLQRTQHEILERRRRLQNEFYVPDPNRV